MILLPCTHIAFTTHFTHTVYYCTTFIPIPTHHPHTQSHLHTHHPHTSHPNTHHPSPVHYFMPRQWFLLPQQWQQGESNSCTIIILSTWPLVTSEVATFKLHKISITPCQWQKSADKMTVMSSPWLYPCFQASSASLNACKPKNKQTNKQTNKQKNSEAWERGYHVSGTIVYYWD